MTNLAKSLLAAAAASALLPAAAAAQTDASSGVYVSANYGINFGYDVTFEGTQAPEAGVPGMAGAPASVEADLDSGDTFGVAIGYRLPARGVIAPRIEAEIGRVSADVEDGSFNGGTQTFGGDIDGTTYGINAYADFAATPGQSVVPYVGVGVGLASLESNVTYFPAVATAPTFAVRGDDTVFTTRLAGGVTIKATQQIEVYGEARYNTFYDAGFERRFIANGNDGLSAEVDDTFSNFGLVGGVRYAF